MKSNNEPQDSKSIAKRSPEEVDAILEQILVEQFGLPKVIPLTNRALPWDRLSQEQIVAEIGRMLVEDFDVPKEIPLTFLREIQWKWLSPEQIEEKISRMLVEVLDLSNEEIKSDGICDVFNRRSILDEAPSLILDKFESHISREEVAFQAQGNLTGASLFVGQRIVVECSDGRFLGKVGDLKTGGETEPVAVRNGAIRLWPDATPGISKAFAIAQTTITDESHE